MGIHTTNMAGLYLGFRRKSPRCYSDGGSRSTQVILMEGADRPQIPAHHLML